MIEKEGNMCCKVTIFFLTKEVEEVGHEDNVENLARKNKAVMHN